MKRGREIHIDMGNCKIFYVKGKDIEGVFGWRRPSIAVECLRDVQSNVWEEVMGTGLVKFWHHV